MLTLFLVGIPDQYELKDGDIINIDVSVYKDGFHGDLNDTYLVGNVDERGRKLVETTRKCLDKAIEMGKSHLDPISLNHFFIFFY